MSVDLLSAESILEVEITQIDVTFAPAIADLQRQVYPEWMLDEVSEYEKCLQSDAISYGAFLGETLVGWIVMDRDTEDTVYLQDIAVLPDWQGNGIARMLWQRVLRDQRWLSQAIEWHARKTSYHLLADPSLLAEAGFRIVYDQFLKDHYDKVYESIGHHEHGHALRAEPIGVDFV